MRVQRPGRVHPDLAARALGDRRRLPAVVDVGVGDDDSWTSSNRWPVRSSASSRLAIEPRLVHAGVDEHDPVAGVQRPGVAVRDAGQVERQPQPPDAGQHPLAAAHLARSGRLAHAAARYRPSVDGEEGPPSEAHPGARVRVPRRAGLRAGAARLDDAGDAAAVRGGRGRQHPLARGRLAAGGRVPVRAPRGALGDRRHRAADAQKELLARFRFASAEERRWIRESLRAHLAEHFPEMEAP